MRNQGITLDTRAVGQHARTVERRSAIPRHTMHGIEEQLNKEGISVTFKQLLGQTIFAGNCLINYGGASLYKARRGLQPAALPDADGPARDDGPGSGR